MVAPHVSEVVRTDPQLTVTGHVKKNARGTEMVVFKIRFLLIEITCIVPIPYEDAETVGVHLKFAVVTPHEALARRSFDLNVSNAPDANE